MTLPQNKSRLRIGIVLPQTKDGGYFQLSLGIADALLKYSKDYEYTTLYYDEEMLGWLMKRTYFDSSRFNCSI